MTYDADAPRFGATDGRPHVVLITLDRETRSSWLTRSDGKEAVLPLDGSVFSDTSKLQKIRFAPGAPAMLFETVDGHDIVVRLAEPEDPAPIAGRPVVYLDHNHWNTLFKALHAPDRVPDPAELDAAHWFIDLVRRNEVIAPKASQHVSETCKWPNAEDRYLLAVTILQLSGGWHLRDPVHLRMEELRASMTAAWRRWPTKVPPAVTLEAVLHSAQLTAPEVGGMPADLGWMTGQLITVTADVDTMLDTGLVELHPQHGWVAHNQRLTDWIADNLTAREHRRRSAEVAFLADLRSEIARVADELKPTSRQFGQWLNETLPSTVSEMRCLGLFRELYFDKTVARVKWEPNDLIDMMYLTAAAGYCDHVVAEREVCAQLTQGIRRLGRPALAHPRLKDLRGHVESRGWSAGLAA